MGAEAEMARFPARRVALQQFSRSIVIANDPAVGIVNANGDGQEIKQRLRRTMQSFERGFGSVCRAVKRRACF